MAYKHVIRAKTKNLFDISRIVESTNLKNNKDGTITVSIYAVSGGLLKNLCPELKVGDVIKVYFQPLRWTATKPPSVMVVGDVVVNRTLNSTLTVTEKSLNKPVWFYNNDYTESGLPGTTIIGNILITTDLTITNKNHNERYTPYNYLQSNKRMIKVSDVCQLLDKSNYEVTSTKVGITWTNNGDGTVTANGNVVSGTIYSAYRISLPQFREVKNNHKYALFSGINNINAAYVECIVYLIKNYSYFFKDCVETNIAGTFGFTIPQGEYSLLQCVELRVRADYTANNLVFKPQLFDLTEMFGAGHEPATVAEFRQRFPNGYYPYSPQCWLTSYKSAVVCKTKNLFNIHNLTAYTPETLPNGTAGVYNGVIISKGRIDDTTCSTGKTLRQLCPDLIVGETYTLNFETTVPSSVGGQYESIHLRGSGNWWRRNRKVITERDLSAVVYIYAETDGAVYITYNLQIEKGSTATSYVPYQHL